MNFSQLLGFVGTILVIVAYAPQVRHVIKEHCSAGVSVRAYDLWITASALFLIHAVIIEDLVFAVVQIANLLAMGVVLVYVRRFQNQICRAHLERPRRHLDSSRFGVDPWSALQPRVRRSKRAERRAC